MSASTRYIWMFAALATLAGCGSDAAAPEAARPVLVVQPGGGSAAVEAYAGEIRAREESPLSFRIAGNLVRREVDMGERVKRGQVLAVLDPGDVQAQAQSAQAQLAAAEAEMTRSRGDMQRYSQLVGEQLVSRSNYDAQVAAYKAAEGQARAARAQLDVARNQEAYSQLRAPRDGVIASREAEAGQVVAAGQTVFTLAADGGREVLIALPENRIREYAVGQPVQVELWSTPGQLLPGSIREISPAADPQTRTYTARVNLPGDAAAAVELGQSARVYAAAAGVAAPLSVPLAAVQRGGDGKPVVWVVDRKAGVAHARPVQAGAYGDDRVPVLGGLQASDWIVAAGGHLLREGQKVVAVDRANRIQRTETAGAVK